MVILSIRPVTLFAAADSSHNEGFLFMMASCLVLRGCFTNIVRDERMNMKSSFSKKASKDWLLKAFPMDFSETSDAPDHGVAHHKAHQKVERSGSWDSS